MSTAAIPIAERMNTQWMMVCHITPVSVYFEAGALGTAAAKYTDTGVMWQTIIHCVFILSAIGIAAVDRMGQPLAPEHH